MKNKYDKLYEVKGLNWQYNILSNTTKLRINKLI